VSIPAIDLPIAEIADLCRKYHVTELALFGSALRDDFTSRSDFDFLVTFDERARVNLFDYAELQIALSDLLNRDVDLVSKKGLRPLIRDEVIAGARVVYAAP
jgi:uncharacterized protein